MSWSNGLPPSCVSLCQVLPPWISSGNVIIVSKKDDGNNSPMAALVTKGSNPCQALTLLNEPSANPLPHPQIGICECDKVSGTRPSLVYSQLLLWDQDRHRSTTTGSICFQA